MSSQSSTSISMEVDNPQKGKDEGPTFQRIFETLSWDNVQSNLQTARPASTRIPPAADTNSAFLDIQKAPSTIDGRKLMEALPEAAVGMKFRADTKFAQIFFDNEDDAEEFIEQQVLQVEGGEIPILPPKGKLPTRVLIRMDNVPFCKKDTITKLLNDKLSEICLPIEIAPMTIKNSRLATSRWEAVVEAISRQNLRQSLTPIIEILGQKVLLSWPSSPATCLQCLTVGHLRKDCPRRKTNQKAETQKGKDNVAPSKTYANIVIQAEPLHNEGPSHKETPHMKKQSNTGNETQGEELYQGPTSVYETPMEVESMKNTITPRTPERSAIPTYDINSPFNEEFGEPPVNQEASTSHKRKMESSPSPVQGVRRNLFAKFKEITSTTTLPITQENDQTQNQTQ